jgi:hypothetical protein
MRQLGVALANLPILRQGRVTQILNGQVEMQADEVEVDLEKLDHTTLWRLFDYVFPVRQQAAMGVTLNELVEGARPAAPPVRPAVIPDASSSDSDSSDSDSSDDDDDKSAAAAPAGKAVPESTVPAIIPNEPVSNEVTIHNPESWAAFAAQGDAAAGGTTTLASNGTAAAGEVAIPAALWAEFARKEAAKAAAEAADAAAKAAAEAADAAAKAAAEAAEAAAKAAAEAKEAAAKAVAEAEEARRVAEREALRERARAELANVEQTVNHDEQRNLMDEMGVGGAADGVFVMPVFPA